MIIFVVMNLWLFNNFHGHQTAVDSFKEIRKKNPQKINSPNQKGNR